MCIYIYIYIYILYIYIYIYIYIYKYYINTIYKPKVTYSVALVMAFLEAENENRQLEGLPQADFGRVPERFLLSVRTKSISENFV